LALSLGLANLLMIPAAQGAGRPGNDATTPLEVGPDPPTLLLEGWLGMEDGPFGFGFGVRAGVRASHRLAVVGEGFFFPGEFEWYALGGLRLSPWLSSTGRLDLDLRGGVGDHGQMVFGNYYVDGVALRVFPILRARAALLLSADNRFALGPMLRIETQPFGKTRVGHLEDGTDAASHSLAFRGHQAMAGAAFEADTGRGGHLVWELMAGVAARGDNRGFVPMFQATLGVQFDPRPAKQARGEVIR